MDVDQPRTGNEPLTFNWPHRPRHETHVDAGAGQCGREHHAVEPVGPQKLPCWRQLVQGVGRTRPQDRTLRKDQRAGRQIGLPRIRAGAGKGPRSAPVVGLSAWSTPALVAT